MFETVTLTGVDVVAFVAASRARALSVWTPFAVAVVFHDTEYGDVVSSAPRLFPSSKNCTPTTPTLSDAFAVTDSVPDTVEPFVGAVSDTVGGVVVGFGLGAGGGRLGRVVAGPVEGIDGVRVGRRAVEAGVLVARRG